MIRIEANGEKCKVKVETIGLFRLTTESAAIVNQLEDIWRKTTGWETSDIMKLIFSLKDDPKRLEKIVESVLREEEEEDKKTGGTHDKD